VNTAITPEQKRRTQLIDELDLGPIGYKLAHPEPGETAMSDDEARAEVVEYRRYLTLCALYPDLGIVPSKRMDRVLHVHILDTAKYIEDCNRVFGGLLHHFPYLGSRGPADLELLRAKFEETRRLYREHFGEDMVGSADGAICASICDGGGCETDPDGGPDNPLTRERPRLVGV
jgi:hypothetical protein